MLRVRVSVWQGLLVGGSKCTALSPPSIPRRGALEQGPKPPTAPGRRSINGCPLLWVCVHGVCVCSLLCVCTWMGKCRARIPSMGHHTWLYVMPLSLKKAKAFLDMFILFTLIGTIVVQWPFQIVMVMWYLPWYYHDSSVQNTIKLTF